MVYEIEAGLGAPPLPALGSKNDMGARAVDMGEIEALTGARRVLV